MKSGILESTFKQIDNKQALLIEVFGLGYVGFPLSLRLATSGFCVSGIDVNENRITNLKNGELHESEIMFKQTLIDCINNKQLLLSTIPAISKKSKVGLICVPTPAPNHHTKSDVFVTAAAIEFLKTAQKGDLIIVESSVEIGTTDNLKKIIQEHGFTVGVDFGLAFCPERIDPQNPKWNLENIPRVIYCSDDITFDIAKKIYSYVNGANLIRVSTAIVAETVKSFENTFRLVNISLVNELAILCDSLKISISEVIGAAATKPFGFMPFYSGAGAGGHCIPKDPLFLLESSKKFGLEFNTIQNALQINSFMPEYVAQSIIRIIHERNLPKKVIICGLAYKRDIDDMRDSPSFKILDHLLNHKFDCAVYDPYFKPELIDRYLSDNHTELQQDNRFNVVSSIGDDNDIILKRFSCLCIVQHHTKNKARLHEIYQNSLVPVIYDCQNKITFDPNSNSILKSLGG